MDGNGGGQRGGRGGQGGGKGGRGGKVGVGSGTVGASLEMEHLARVEGDGGRRGGRNRFCPYFCDLVHVQSVFHPFPDRNLCSAVPTHPLTFSPKEYLSFFSNI